MYLCFQLSILLTTDVKVLTLHCELSQEGQLEVTFFTNVHMKLRQVCDVSPDTWP